MNKITRSSLVLICTGLSLLWSLSLYRSPDFHDGVMPDFREIYYAGRCALHHNDPYNPAQMRAVFDAEGGKFPPHPVSQRKLEVLLFVVVYLPTAMLLTLPIALLPLFLAKLLWMLLNAGVLALAAYLVSDLCLPRSRTLWAWMAAFLLLNSVNILASGNAAALVVGLSIMAVWCFLKNRFGLLGVLLLSVALAMKPHDSGFLWLFFLLAGGLYRKRALQALAVTALLAMLAVLWVHRVSPHWLQEMHENNVVVTAPGNTSDPAATNSDSGTMVQIIDLQSAFTVFTNDYATSQAAGFLVSGVAIGLWIFLVARRPVDMEHALLALAAVSALSILPVYHLPYDAKLLLLTIPACGMLWSSKARGRWTALILTWTAIAATGDIPLIAITTVTSRLTISSATWAGKLEAMLLLHPVPILLLGTGGFYLWAFATYRQGHNLELPGDGEREKPVVPYNDQVALQQPLRATALES